jgi:YggT family protein
VYAWNNLIIFVARTVDGLLTLYFWVVIIAALLTWVQPDPYNPIVRFLYGVTEPVFDWVREHLPVVLGGIDLSPIVVIIAIEFLQQYLIPTLTRAMISGVASLGILANHLA